MVYLSPIHTVLGELLIPRYLAGVASTWRFGISHQAQRRSPISEGYGRHPGIGSPTMCFVAYEPGAGSFKFAQSVSAINENKNE